MHACVNKSMLMSYASVDFFVLSFDYTLHVLREKHDLRGHFFLTSNDRVH